MTPTDRARVRRMLKPLRMAGAQLANCAYNLKQGANALPPETKERLGEVQDQWDAAVSALPRWARKKPERKEKR